MAPCSGVAKRDGRWRIQLCADVGALRSPVCGRLIAFDGAGGRAVVRSSDRAFGDVVVQWQADAVTLAAAGVSAKAVGDYAGAKWKGLPGAGGELWKN